MFRKFLRKIIPSHAIFPLLLCGIGLVMSFGFVKILQRIIDFNYVDITTGLDAFFAFNPGWVLVYAETFIFWLLTYILTAHYSATAANRLAAADLVSKVLCLLFFLFLPTTMVRPELEEGGLFNFGMWLVYTIDTPTNLFPSMHCSIAWMGARMLIREVPMKRKVPVAIASFGFAFLIFLSTLYTKQHLFVDVIGGVLVSEIGILVMRFTKLSEKIEHLSNRFLETKLGKWL